MSRHFSSPFARRFGAAALTCLAVLTGTARAQDPNYKLSATHHTGQPGDVVTVIIGFDNMGGNVQGWSFGIAVPPELDILDAREGTTTAAFKGGNGPDFNGTTIYPGEGVTVGVLICFTGTEWLPPGTGYELHEIDVLIPAGTPPGSQFDLEFTDTLGSPPVAIVIVVNGQSNDPTLCDGSVGTEGGATTYCTAKKNSCNTLPEVSFNGTPSATASSGFEVFGSRANFKKAGYLLYTDNGRQNIPFQGGILCVAGPIRRTIVVQSQGGAAGTCDSRFSIDMNAFAQGALGGSPKAFLLIPGQQINVQYWGRDTVANGSYLTNGGEYVVGP